MRPGKLSDYFLCRGNCTIVGCCSCRIVSKRQREVVGKFSGSHEHLFRLSLSVADSDQVTEGQETHGMARSTHLLVHLVSTPDRGMVQGVECAIVGPRQLGCVKNQVCFYLLVQLVCDRTTHSGEKTQ